MSDDWEDYEPLEEDEEEEVPRPLSRKRRAASDPRGNLYLLTGLILGIGLGLLFSWVLFPTHYVDTDPASLAPAYKDEYRRVIARAYEANHDLGRASEREALLDADSAVHALAAQAQRMLAENQSPQEARSLAILAADLGRSPSQLTASALAVAQATSTLVQITTRAETTTSVVEDTAQPAETITATLNPEAAIQTPTLPPPTRTPTITLTAVPTYTPRPTATPLPVLDAPFTLKSKRQVCDRTVQPGYIQVQVSGAGGEPLPGVQITVAWQDSQESFYTGLAPEINPGYADFHMDDGITYSVRAGEVSDTAEPIQSKDGCGWVLEFSQQKR